MNKSYRIVALQRQDDGSVQVTLQGITGPDFNAERLIVFLPAGAPEIAALTINRQVNAVFTAV